MFVPPEEDRRGGLVLWEGCRRFSLVADGAALEVHLNEENNSSVAAQLRLMSSKAPRKLCLPSVVNMEGSDGKASWPQTPNQTG